MQWCECVDECCSGSRYRSRRRARWAFPGLLVTRNSPRAPTAAAPSGRSQLPSLSRPGSDGVHVWAAAPRSGTPSDRFAVIPARASIRVCLGANHACSWLDNPLASPESEHAAALSLRGLPSGQYRTLCAGPLGRQIPQHAAGQDEAFQRLQPCTTNTKHQCSACVFVLRLMFPRRVTRSTTIDYDVSMFDDLQRF